MPTADKLEWRQGTPLFNTAWRAVSEGLRGVGYLSPGSFSITTTANALEVEIGGGTVWYPPDGQDYSVPGTTTLTLSAGDGTHDRWDLLYLETGTVTVEVREGTPDQYPDLPDIQTGEVLLGYAYVPQSASDISDSEVYEWATTARKAADTRLDDSAGDYSGTTVEDALTEVIREAGDPLNGPLDLSGFSGSAPFDLGDDPGAFGAVVDATVTSNSSAGTTHSYALRLDSSNVLLVTAEADGSGGVQNARLDVLDPLRLDADLSTTGGTTIWDASAGEVPPAVRADMGSTDLTAGDGATTIFDSSTEEVPRTSVDDEKTTTTVSASTATTADEEVVFVDTAAIGASSTITLASADATAGNTIVVSDLSGSASDYPIVVETEGTETIHGLASKEIATAGGALVFTSDGTNWSLGGGGAGGGTKPTNVFEGREGGSVADGDDGLLVVDSLADGETVEVYKATLVNQNVGAVPTDVDLELVTFDNSGGKTVQTTLLSGDGSTVHDSTTGQPLGSYSNASGAESSIGVVVSNASGSSVDIFASAEGERNV